MLEMDHRRKRLNRFPQTHFVAKNRLLLDNQIYEGSLSFAILSSVGNSRQSWLKGRGYAGKPHWEHDFAAVD
jgi:hypothetical protein